MTIDDQLLALESAENIKSVYETLDLALVVNRNLLN